MAIQTAFRGMRLVAFTAIPRRNAVRMRVAVAGRASCKTVSRVASLAHALFRRLYVQGLLVASEAIVRLVLCMALQAECNYVPFGKFAFFMFIFVLFFLVLFLFVVHLRLFVHQVKRHLPFQHFRFVHDVRIMAYRAFLYAAVAVIELERAFFIRVAFYAGLPRGIQVDSGMRGVAAQAVRDLGNLMPEFRLGISEFLFLRVMAFFEAELISFLDGVLFGVIGMYLMAFRAPDIILNMPAVKPILFVKKILMAFHALGGTDVRGCLGGIDHYFFKVCVVFTLALHVFFAGAVAGLAPVYFRRILAVKYKRMHAFGDIRLHGIMAHLAIVTADIFRLVGFIRKDA